MHYTKTAETRTGKDGLRHYEFSGKRRKRGNKSNGIRIPVMSEVNPLSAYAKRQKPRQVLIVNCDVYGLTSGVHQRRNKDVL